MPNILYLHGLASGPQSHKARFFQRQFAQIGAEVHVPDLTAGDFAGLTLTKQLEVVDRNVAALEPVMVIGSSLGGYLAAIEAGQHPEHGYKLVLLAPAFAFARRWAEELGEEEIQRWKASGTRPVYHYGQQGMAEVGYQLYEDALWHDEFPEVTQPALIYHGQRDDVVDPRLSVQFAWGKPNVRLELLDSDHQLLDVTETLWEGVAAFYYQG